MQRDTQSPQNEIDAADAMAKPHFDETKPEAPQSDEHAASVDPVADPLSESRRASASRVSDILAAARKPLSALRLPRAARSPRRPRATGKRADRLIIIAASGMLAIAAAVIAIGAMDALPGQSAQVAPAQTNDGGSNPSNIDIGRGATLSEGGQPVGNPALGTPGPVTGPFISGDEKAGVEFSTSHIHLIDPASSPNTPTPAPTPTETPSPDAQ